MHWRRKWQLTPVFLPGESQGRGSLVGCRLWGRTESARLKRLSSYLKLTHKCTGCARPCRSVAERSYPLPEVRGGGREEQPLARGQGRRPGEATPRPRSGEAAEMGNPTSKEQRLTGTVGPRGATPRLRSGGAAVRRYLSSKVRSSGCTLLEQL